MIKKRILVFSLLAVLLAVVAAQACPGISAQPAKYPWKSGRTTVTLNDGTLRVKGKGRMKDYSLHSRKKNYPDLPPWYNFKSGITGLVIEEGVTHIGNEAFASLRNLNSVTIPGSVTTIGNAAFAGTGLTSVTISRNVTEIGSNAFRSCTSLTSITVAADNGLYSSEDGVLFNKDKTVLIRYPSGKPGAYTVPGSVTSVGESAFQGCVGLTSVTVPRNVETIGDYAFYNSAGLRSVTIEDGVTSIGYSTFFECTGLKSITIPNSVTTINYATFSGCTGLMSVTIPGSVTEIDPKAFFECTGLTSIIVQNPIPPKIRKDAPPQFIYGDKEKKEKAFSSVSKFRACLYVPEDSADAYRDADEWEDFECIYDLESAPGGK